MRQAAALFCLLLLALTFPVRAQTQIHRCIGANGGAVFTDQPCAALQATPIRPSTTQASTTALPSPPPNLCAGSLDALRQGVIDAFAARNPNRLAGLMLWDGYGRGAAISDIRSLNELMKHPLLDINIPDDGSAIQQPSATPDLGGMSADPFAPPMPAAPRPAAPAGNELVLHTADNDGSGSPQERRFSVVRRAGCLWLRSQ